MLVSATDSTVRFDSFLAALDASEVLPIPFAPHLHYIPLVQQEGHSVQPVIFGKAMDGARIFVRSCYTALWKLIQQQRDDYIDNKLVSGGALITGNSGVGMSIFLAYVIKQLRSLTKPPTIVYDSLAKNRCYIIRPGSSHVESYQEPPFGMDRDRSIVYLVDVCTLARRPPSQCSAFTIVVAEPYAKGQNILKGWKKYKYWPSARYLPCWNESELEVYRRVTRPSADEQKKDQLKGTCLLPAMSSETVAQRFALFGGIARVALARGSLSDLKAYLNGALGSCNLGTVTQYPGPDLERFPMDSSWIFHYKVNPDSFKLDSIDFASKPILEQVWDRYSAKQVMHFIEATSWMSSVWNGVRWNLFQLLAHEHLQKGGTFAAHKLLLVDSNNDQAQRVQDSKPSTLTLPTSSSVRSVADAAAITHLTAGEYGQLSKANFKTIDAVIRPNCLFQTTVSESHTVNIDELIAAVNALQLKPDEPVRFYFVVPPEQFATFQAGTFTASDTSSSLTIANVPDTIEYWVLQMIYPQAEPELVISTSKRKDMASSTSPPPSPKMSKTY